MILAADLGTSSLKAGILAPDGALVARVRIPYQHGSGAENLDFNPLSWEEAFLSALKQLPAVKLSALALSGNGPTLVPCKINGDPVAPADLWLQNRSIRVDGTSSYYLPKAAWLKANNTRTWKRTQRLYSCPEWLQLRLTGSASMTLPHEGFRRYIWDREQLKAYNLDSILFPDLVPMGTVAGRISEATSARTGLPAGLPVAATGSDFMAALIGSGTTSPGMVCDRAGTSEGINYCAEKPSGDTRLRDLPHAVEPFWNVAAILSSTGAVFEWYRRLTGQADIPYEETLNEAATAPAGAGAPLFFPGLRGDTLWEFAGGSFHHLEPVHGRAEMGRAVMEAIGFAVRRGIELLEEAGMPVVEMRVTGGQARGVVWNQMKADITGRRLLIPEVEDAELVGCACCASAALGRYESPLEASKVLVHIREVVDPDPDAMILYNDAYGRYRHAVSELKRTGVPGVL